MLKPSGIFSHSDLKQYSTVLKKSYGGKNQNE